MAAWLIEEESKWHFEGLHIKKAPKNSGKIHCLHFHRTSRLAQFDSPGVFLFCLLQFAPFNLRHRARYLPPFFDSSTLTILGLQYGDMYCICHYLEQGLPNFIVRDPRNCQTNNCNTSKNHFLSYLYRTEKSL